MRDSGDRSRRRRLARVTASMTSVNAVIMVAALVTGPLLARALGPAGRGDLAAILVPFSLAPLILHLGLGVHGAREAARGKDLDTLLGSLCAAALVVGVLGALAGVPLAAVLADGRGAVHDYLVVAFGLLPIGLVGTVLVSLNSGLERWGVVIASRLIPPVSAVAAMTVLYFAGALTVQSAAIVSFVGGVASTLVLLGVLRGRRFRFDPSVIRSGLPFGMKAWVGSLANLTNARLDQLLMIPLVSARQLGLYAVAVSLAGFSGALTAGLGPPLFTRVASGESELAARALRVTLALVGATTAIVGAATPFLIDFLFGSSFSDAVLMAWILLVAGVPLAGASVMAVALTAAGRAGTPAVAETVALVATVGGLLLLLRPLGGVGAAMVSLAAYSINFALQLRAARREFGCPLSTFLVIGCADITWARDLVTSTLAARRVAVQNAG
jgi:O-antigen/teichoic acid export membrane protein